MQGTLLPTSFFKQRPFTVRNCNERVRRAGFKLEFRDVARWSAFPQRLKPWVEVGFYGMGEPMPLAKRGFLHVSLGEY
jgi:hypothetical protein